MSTDQEKIHGSSGYEKKDVNLVRVGLFGVAGVIFLIVVVVLLSDFFVASREEMVQDKVLKPESIDLRELRARENEELTTYGVIDKDKGIYRIPVERAMQLLAQEAYAARIAKVKSK